MLRPRSSPLSSPTGARTGAVLTSMDAVTPYLGDALPPPNASAPRAASGSADAGTFSMVLVVGVVIAGVALFAGRHA